MSRRQRRQPWQRKTMTLPIVVALVAITIVVAFLIVSQPGGNNSSPLIGNDVSQSDLNLLSSVSYNTLSVVGGGGSGVSSPGPITAPSPLTSNGKPEILYIGGEYCPYCGAERWALTVALSKFGNFSGLKYMLSAPPPESPANIATFTFVNTVYTSKYISFVSVETSNRQGPNFPLQTLTPDQQSLMNTYDTSGSIPFVDFGNKYVLVGSQLQPSVLVGKNWTQIASQLDTPSSTIAQNIDGAANRLISVICKLTSNQPSSVCSQPFIQTLGFTGGPDQTGAQSLTANPWQEPMSRNELLRVLAAPPSRGNL